jgi:hypothetical protein
LTFNCEISVGERKPGLESFRKRRDRIPRAHAKYYRKQSANAAARPARAILLRFRADRRPEDEHGDIFRQVRMKICGQSDKYGQD